ncbi:class I SAM-dependent methyltransferase [Paenibacillus sp. MMS18-CY102]|uniref:class I SAM-dependent methyltransferase n=1 Tax=Paenibacillus sp. MMS18-CY102 TaxID=2682849 RepID=UPI001365F481|nr:class I SAM-dependent methyltransferase [Paenibacillus sp. MMS18-CY102]MWC29268.1 methyltransferase domain-containing protein [Paenibacillus sp. MMS18-CY102]
MNADHNWKARWVDEEQVDSDTANRPFVFKVPTAWWTRSDEWAWSGLFVHPDRVVLDSSLSRGIIRSNTLDYESRHSPRIVSLQSVFEQMQPDDEPALDALAVQERLERDALRFIRADITQLPYEDEKFDTVFCLSVIEALEQTDAREALLEFRRTLKTGGLLVLTFEEQSPDLAPITRTVRDCGYSFAGEYESAWATDGSNNTNAQGRLYAFRAI